MCEAIQQTQRETPEAGGKTGCQNVSWCNKSLPTPPRNRDFSYQRFRKLPDCIAARVPTKFAGENEVAGSTGSCRPPNSFSPTRPIPEMAIAGRPAVLPVLSQID